MDLPGRDEIVLTFSLLLESAEKGMGYNGAPCSLSGGPFLLGPKTRRGRN